MLAVDLRLPAETIRHLGVIVNIGLVGRVWPPSRRFLTVNFVRPDAPADGESAAHGVSLLPLATWDEQTDTFIPATDAALDDLAAILGMGSDDLRTTLAERAQCIEVLSRGRGVGVRRMREAVDSFGAAVSTAEAEELAEDADGGSDDEAED
jgi:hypothetical protein